MADSSHPVLGETLEIFVYFVYIRLFDCWWISYLKLGAYYAALASPGLVIYPRLVSDLW